MRSFQITWWLTSFDDFKGRGAGFHLKEDQRRYLGRYKWWYIIYPEAQGVNSPQPPHIPALSMPTYYVGT